MSLLAASKYSRNSEDRELEQQRQQLAGGGDEMCSLVLVRPDIEVDTVWAEYTANAKESWATMNADSLKSSWGSGFGSLFSSSDLNEQNTEIRYHRDVDIIAADGSELAMGEKVFLLVNRILNDKMSLPGYVYRYLIRKCIVRGSARDNEPSVPSSSPNCSCIADAHGVIKHVTATLLDVRKGLASSPALTEMCANAVEVLVFGELYDGVFQEIVQQTLEQHKRFVSKVECRETTLYRALDSGEERGESSYLSQSAIVFLEMLPRAHTTTEKLFYAVSFLESISEHFSNLFQDRCIDADTLLTMVCQHILAANEVNFHAEVAFVEEFARDEQLLCGKEGYALITLQASLHHLTACDENDYIA